MVYRSYLELPPGLMQLVLVRRGNEWLPCPGPPRRWRAVLLRPPVKRGSNAGQAGQTGVNLTPGQGQCVTLRTASGYLRLARFGKDNWEPAVIFFEQGHECLLGRGLQGK